MSEAKHTREELVKANPWTYSREELVKHLRVSVSSMERAAAEMLESDAAAMEACEHIAKFDPCACEAFCRCKACAFIKTARAALADARAGKGEG